MFVSKATQSNTLFIYGHILLSLVLVWSYCSGDLLCPKIKELGSPVKLTCIQALSTRVHSYSTPGGAHAASCDLAENRCITLGDFTSTVLNGSSTVLTIPRLLKTHAGDWTCVVDPDSTGPDTCHIAVEKSPSCQIMSKQDTGAVRTGEELSLTVNVTEFYCSETAHVQVKTGDITGSLLNETVSALTNSTENLTLNITTLHFGNVSLVFSCGSNSQVMFCEGVRELVQSIPPVSTTETDVTNTTTSEKVSTVQDYSTLISVGIIFIVISGFIVIALVLVRRRWHNLVSQPTKEDDGVHYVRETDPEVPHGSPEADTESYKDAPLASEEDTRSETL